jgi:hypothetical protein
VGNQGLIAHQLYESHKAARRAAHKERDLAKKDDFHVVGEGAELKGGSSVFVPDRIQQDPEPRRRYRGEGLTGETYPFLMIYYLNRHP